MTNFPFFQHHVIKLVFSKEERMNEELIDKIANILVKVFELNVVSRGKYEFEDNGLTKFWILSQSHLVIHSWPEDNAVHIDLMTCSPSVIDPIEVERCLSSFSIKEVSVKKLKY